MNTQDIRRAISVDELDAWARHAHAAGGFGDGAAYTARGVIAIHCKRASAPVFPGGEQRMR